MNQSLILLFTIFSLFCFSRATLDQGPCSNSQLRVVKNIGTGLLLGIQRLKVINSHVKQEWCISDESAATKQVITGGTQNHQKVVFYCQNSNYIMQVLYGQVANALINLVPNTIDVSAAGLWDLVYVASSQSYSIRTELANGDNLALAAVSNNPVDGLTLKPYDENDVLQQWSIEKAKRKGED